MKEIGCQWDDLEDREFGIETTEFIRDPNLKKQKQELFVKSLPQNETNDLQAAIAEAQAEQQELMHELRRVADDVFVFSNGEEETRTRSVSLAVPQENRGYNEGEQEQTE
uniref:Scaffolding protein n=1 Tax=Steinernema glaseri TaxID=37863 RepID=A0A1I8AAS7_9BILA